jgi:hypothetical protein
MKPMVGERGCQLTANWSFHGPSVVRKLTRNLKQLKAIILETFPKYLHHRMAQQLNGWYDPCPSPMGREGIQAHVEYFDVPGDCIRMPPHKKKIAKLQAQHDKVGFVKTQ